MTEQVTNLSAGDGEWQHDALPGKAALSLDDQTLVGRSRQGDMQAFGALVMKYQHRVYNLIGRMCSRNTDAEELAQETFLRALQRIGQFRGTSQFYTWLFRIAVNLTISHRRRCGKVRFHPLGGTGEFGENLAPALTSKLAEQRRPSPDAAATASESHRIVLAALEELDEDYRVVVLLRDLEEMDYAGIAAVLDLPVGTVKSRIHRARLILREKLADVVE
ncbi:MAG: sigma-70 family RNA polymerase sigma factor [Planctomycetota bacterium]